MLCHPRLLYFNLHLRSNFYTSISLSLSSRRNKFVFKINTTLVFARLQFPRENRRVPIDFEQFWNNRSSALATEAERFRKRGASLFAQMNPAVVSAWTTGRRRFDPLIRAICHVNSIGRMITRFSSETGRSIGRRPAS